MRGNAGPADSQRKGCGRDVVGCFDYCVDVTRAKCEIHRFDLTAQSLRSSFDSRPPAGTTVLDQLLQARLRIRGFDQILRHLGVLLEPTVDAIENPSPRLRQILLDRMREVLHGHRLQPYASRTCERGQENSVASEERVLDARDGCDVELNRLLVHPHVPWVYAQ